MPASKTISKGLSIELLERIVWYEKTRLATDKLLDEVYRSQLEAALAHFSQLLKKKKAQKRKKTASHKRELIHQKAGVNPQKR